jgi:hypothetical protein
MSITQALLKIEQAGFSLAIDGPDLVINPPGKLSPAQRQYIVDHKAEIMSALLESSPAGNDHPPANDDRVTIHIPEFQLQTGQKVSFNATVPKANLNRMRESVKFNLIDHQGAGSILGEPGKTHEELTEILINKYGNRLQSTY